MIPFQRVLLLLVLFFVLTASISIRTADALPTDSAPFSLDCVFREGNGMFAPQQSVIVDAILRPTSPNSNVAVPLTLHVELTNLSLPNRPSVAGFSTQITPNVPLPISFVTPEKEGVYEITLTTIHEAKPQRPILNLPRPSERNTIEIRRQIVVLDSQVTPRSTGDWTLTDRRNLSPCPEYRLNEEPSRRLLPQLPNIPYLPPLPKVAELPRITDLPRPAELLRLPRPFNKQNSPEAPPEEVFNLLFGEYAHFMPMDTEIGKPYLVEIDYSVNVPHTLGIGVIDYIQILRSSDGIGTGVAVVRNTAANIHVAEEVVQDTHTETVATHRLLFWAGTEHPKLVLVNKQPYQEDLFHNIRISQVVMPDIQEDRRLPKLFEGTAQRKRIGQILDANGLQHLTNVGEPMNWHEAYEGASRLFDTLSRGGYDGVAFTMLSKKSPSSVYDRNDGFEMLFRRFNSEELTLIPAIEFDMPLPSLELLLRQHPGITEEVLIGNPADRRYNVLHPAVQQAMAETVLELVDRFGHHPSFGGVAIVLSPETCAQLPFALIPPDDHTWTQFQRETEQQLGVPFPDEQQLRRTMPIQQFLVRKNAVRLQFLQDKNNPKVWEMWVRWRAAKVSDFYADLAKQVADKRADVPLYLLGGTMLDQPEIQQFCAPTLPRNLAPLQAIQLLGFDLQLLSKAGSLHFLRPVQISEEKNYCYDGLNSVDTVSFFSKSGVLPGVQFVHTGDPVAGSLFVTTPAHTQSRKRFVRQLAQADVLMFMDAGVTLPFGQEPAMFDLLDTYRQLPPVPFQTFYNSTETQPSSQPLTIRYKNLSDKIIVYIVNDAPFAVEADFVFSADSRSTMTELTGHRMIRSFSRNPQQPGSHTWRASLQPYDLLAIQINDTHAKIESVSVHCPPSLCGADGVLKQKVEELAQRIHTVRNGAVSEKLVNGDFELPVDATDGIVGWQCFGKSLTAQQDHVVVCKGQNSVKLTNSSAEAGMFLCQPLSIPATNRLGVSMFVGVSVDCQSLPMSVVLTARHRGEPFYRSVPVGETLMSYLENVEPKNGVRWYRLLVPFERERLPLEPLEEIRIGIQYSGVGTVWLDDITLHQVLFSANEIVELQKMLAVADQRCSSGRFSHLIALLEDYWAQFLFQHVPTSIPQPVHSTPKPPVAKEADPPKPPPTLYQRMRGWFGSGV